MRVVATSDTHLQQPGLPDGDVLIHAGDLINDGMEAEFLEGLHWLSKHQHPVKIYVPGNHDKYAYDARESAQMWCKSLGIHMLVDETVCPNTIAIHGSPWTNLWGKTAAYMKPAAEINKYWESVSHDMDILVTHGPPWSMFDIGRHGFRLGSEGLYDAVTNLQPAVHLFGHIHEGHGGRRWQTWSNGKKTLFANIAACGSKVMGLMLNDDPILEFDIEREGDGIVKITLDGEEYIC